MDFLSQNTPSPGSSSRTKEHGRRSLNLLLLAAAMLAALMACGDPKYQPPAIVVTFDPNFPPPASLNTGAYAGIAAVVTNDTKNAGVNLSCIPDTPRRSVWHVFQPRGRQRCSSLLPGPRTGSNRESRDRDRNLSNRSHQVHLGPDHRSKWRCEPLPVTVPAGSIAESRMRFLRTES
jgi:hypothetical protein